MHRPRECVFKAKLKSKDRASKACDCDVVCWYYERTATSNAYYELVILGNEVFTYRFARVPDEWSSNAAWGHKEGIRVCFSFSGMSGGVGFFDAEGAEKLMVTIDDAMAAVEEHFFKRFFSLGQAKMDSIVADDGVDGFYC
jgi:hypothetical protein